MKREKKQRKTELLGCGLLERCNHSMLANCLRRGELFTGWRIVYGVVSVMIIARRRGRAMPTLYV
jgi:hypothetical protein